MLAWWFQDPLLLVLVSGMVGRRGDEGNYKSVSVMAIACLYHNFAEHHDDLLGENGGSIRAAFLFACSQI